jgi:hypothetical protein
MTRVILLLRSVPALLATLLAIGCAAPSASEQGLPAEPAPESAGKDEASAAERARALAAARRKVEAAEQALLLEQVEARGEVAQAQEELRAAEFEQREADTKLDAHQGDAELRTRRAYHQLAEAESRLIAARADLAGLQRIYAEEPEVLVKEEILRRKQADVDFATERRELARIELERLGQVDLPTQQRELEERLRAASAEVVAKRHALEEAELGARKSVKGAENALLDARDDVHEAEEALAKDGA